MPVAAPPVPVGVPDSATRFFFLRGHPRSGTNWLGSILNLHPEVYCHGEFHLEDIRFAIDLLKQKPWQSTGREPVRTLMDECFHDMVRRILLTLKPKKPWAIWIGDRTPRGLRPLLPDSPVIWLIRDGRDVLVSWTFHVLRQPDHVQNIVIPDALKASMESQVAVFRADPNHFASRPDELLANEGWVRFIAKRWGDWASADLVNKKAIEAGEVESTLCTVRYEVLHADTESERARIYRFLGLDPALADPLSPETRTTAGFGREDPLSFFRYGEVGDWKQYFAPGGDAARWFKESAGQGLIDLEYEKDDSW
jgi:Sulfotransferase family